MSLPQETLIDLMAYADGELDGEARARIEALIASSDDARRVIEAMGALGDVVRDGVEARGDAVAIDDVADQVIAKIDRGATTVKGSRIVVPIATARRSRGPAIAGTVGLILALAAGALLVIRAGAPPREPTAANTPLQGSANPTALEAPASGTPSPEPSAAVAEAEEHGVDLVEVSSTQNKVNVFFVPPATLAGAAASVVVWIDDKGPAAAGGMK